MAKDLRSVHNNQNQQLNDLNLKYKKQRQDLIQNQERKINQLRDHYETKKQEIKLARMVK